MNLSQPMVRRGVLALAVIVFYGALVGVSVHAAFSGSATRNDTAVAADGLSRGDTSSSVDDGTDSGGSGDASVGGVNSTGGGGTTATTVRRTVTTVATKRAAPTITIGIHDDNPSGAGQAYGVKGLGGNQIALVQEVVDWINKNGGMGGRHVEVVAHVTDNLNGTFDQQAQEACVDFTEDHHVAAVVGGAKIPTLNLPDCLAKHKTPLVWDYHFMADGPTLDRYADYLYMPTMVRLERLGPWIDAESDRGFFKNGKIGLVRWDEPLSKRLADQVVKARLAAHGYSVADEVAFNPANGAASAADISAQSNSAILRFRSEGIDRVIFEPTAGIMPLLFLTSAQSQGYHPRFTFTSYDVPSFQAENNANELSGTEAFGWLPAGDVLQPQQPPLNPTAKLCVSITPNADPPANGSIRRYCDGLMFLKAIFDHGADTTPASIRRVAESLGSAWESPWTIKSAVTPTKHDGASVGHVVAFDDACACFTMSGADIPIP